MRTKRKYLFLLPNNEIDAFNCIHFFLVKFYLLFTHQELISYINHSSSHFVTEVVKKIFTYVYGDSAAH